MLAGSLAAATTGITREVVDQAGTSSSIALFLFSWLLKLVCRFG